MKYISLIIFVFSLGLTNVSIGYAEDSPRTIKVIGRKEASVTTKVITLSDVARIESKRVEDDDVIIGLQKIVIQESPAPGESVGIPALSILERIKHSGVDTEQIGYMFPRVIKVKRASRTIRIEEIRGAIERYLSKTGRDANLNSIQYNNDVEVAPGLARISAIPTGQARAGKTKFQVQVDVEDERRVAFDIPVDIDEWLEVPVANRPLPKGSVISPIDIARARLNMASM
ncbi:MAG: hypothetical protein KDD53_06985, partial [Bdellovibrionales bacterium]|nr:hypothetical protein [Bdellovibrionales bacterium]